MAAGIATQSFAALWPGDHLGDDLALLASPCARASARSSSRRSRRCPGTLVCPAASVGTKPALDLDAELLEAEPRAVRAHADRDEDDVGLDRLGLAADVDAHGDRSVALRARSRGPWRP